MDIDFENFTPTGIGPFEVEYEFKEILKISLLNDSKIYKATSSLS